MENPRQSSKNVREVTSKPRVAADKSPLVDRRIFDALTRIAQGDLGFPFNGAPREFSGAGKELLLNLDGLARKLRYIVGRLQRAADSIETVVGEVLRGTQTLSASVIDEAKSVEETFSSISEINSSTHSIGGNLESLSSLTQSTASSISKMATSIDHVSQNAEELAQFVDETTSAIEQMASSIRKVAESTETLAESAEKTARSMAAIDDSTRRIDDSVKETTVLAEEVARSADAGSQLVSETAASVLKIKEAIDAATETINRLGKRSEQIGEVTHVIDEIADRTHLLALNAAILAAQAGPQGRGFRIVADEIKELSERTAASTREIDEMIKAVRGDVVETIERVVVGGERADQGVELAARASELLTEIRDKTTTSSDRVRQIADATAVQAAESHTVLEAADSVRQQARDIERATNEQAQTAKQIGERALHMSELTKQVQRATNEQAKVSRYIASTMEELSHVVEQIRGASNEQAAGVEQVLRAIGTIQEVVDRNQASISGINSAVDLLVREAELLNREVEAFSLPTPEHGGRLTFALRTSQLTLDPATVSSISRNEVISNIFEGLVQFGERAEIRPAIAERWEISPDGRRYTFYLREAARFHNGLRVRAEDVKYSFERQMRQNEAAAGWVFRPLVGAEEFMQGQAETISGIRILGEKVVRLELTQPVAFFLSTLCMDYAYVVPREEAERPTIDFESKPIGSGPFRLVEPITGNNGNNGGSNEVQLERFANYWNPELPYLDRLTIKFGSSAEEIFQAFLRGELDYVSDLPLTYLQELKQRAGDVHLLEALQLQTRMLVFGCDRPPLDDRRVRQAICYAINRERFIDEVYAGMAEPGSGPIPPGLLGYDAQQTGYRYDPERARRLLEEAGYGGGFETEIWWSDSVNTAVEVLQEDLADVGIRAQCRYVGLVELQRALRLRAVPIVGRDWYADYPDPDNFTYVLFNSRNRNLFIAAYANDKVDELTDEARSVMNREQRELLYKEVTRLIIEDAPCAFLAHRRSFVAHRADLEGVTLNLLSPFVRPKDLWFAKQKEV